MQVIRAVDLGQEDVGNVPLRTLPAVPQPSAPYFHASIHTLTRSAGGRTMLVAGPMLVTFQPLDERARQRERRAIAAAARANANSVSQRGMFNI